VIDIHCHILPGLDDGPRSLDISIAMAAAAAEDGITAIIATPHTDGIRINHDTVPESVHRLNEELKRQKISVEVYPGYEIPSSKTASLAHNHTLAGSKYFLLEFPHTHLPADAALIIASAISHGLQPIIAHPERNPDILFRPDLLADLVAAGAFSQVTAVSITGELGIDVQRCAHHLLSRNLVHFIATDSHSPSFRRPVLSEARRIVRRLADEETAARLFLHNGCNIVSPGI